MLFEVAPSSATRSRMEEMLDSLMRRDEKPKDTPPALPVRPTSKARLPSRRPLPINFKLENAPESLPSESVKGSSPSAEKASEEYQQKKEDWNLLGDNKLGLKSMNLGQLEEVEVPQLRVEDGFAVSGLESQRVSKAETAVESTYGRREQKKRTDDSDSGVPLSSIMCGDCEWNDNIGYILKEDAEPELVQAHPADLAELQGRVLKAEAALRQKEDENSILQQQLQEYNKRWLEYEAKIKSIEETWQKQVTSLQDAEPEQVQAHPEDLAELQGRVLKAEAALRQKEDQNSILEQQLQEYSKRWLEYEAKIKSVEETWQKQVTSLQMSLAAAKKTLAKDVASPAGRPDASPLAHNYDSEDTMSVGTCTPNRSPWNPPAQPADAGNGKEPNMVRNAVVQMVKEFENRKQVFDNDAGFLVEVKSGQLDPGANSKEELRKLKQRFAAWKKDYKARLRETKAALQKHGNGESHHARKKWWGMRITKGA